MNYPFKVILAGAGPGDESLVTVKLVECLKQADVILVDRLVNNRIIELYANPVAKIVPVGKEGHTENSTLQKDINKLLVHFALQGLKVVRLKGGDVAIYSNVLEEIHALQTNSISFEIIPGITAASGVAATLQVPLTGRDIAPGVQIHTLSAKTAISEELYAQWALTRDTLVFYMSTTLLNDLAVKLLSHGAQDKPVAIVEQGTTPFQVNTFTKLSSIETITKLQTFQSPTIIIIGDILMHANIKSNITSTLAFFNSYHSQNKKLHAV